MCAALRSTMPATMHSSCLYEGRPGYMQHHKEQVCQNIFHSCTVLVQLFEIESGYLVHLGSLGIFNFSICVLIQTMANKFCWGRNWFQLGSLYGSWPSLGRSLYHNSSSFCCLSPGSTSTVVGKIADVSEGTFCSASSVNSQMKVDFACAFGQQKQFHL